ncbi:type III secretion system chaperone [Acidovorax sp. LjRoot194]|uniref:type III secretion system chaperone n=1 Tax=Acidovorax sp. LjRoot194 TaxID=3342280 RepID=UPI003ED0D2B2
MTDTAATRSALFDALRQAAGLFPVELDAQGACTLAFDQIAVHLQHDAAAHALTCFAVLGAVPSARREEVMAAMLRANRFWRGTGGATLSLDENEPASVLLSQRFDERVPGASAEFVQAVERFVDHAQDWSTFLGGEPQGTAAQSLTAEAQGGMAFFHQRA